MSPKKIKSKVQHINPDTLHKNPAFTNVVVINSPAKMVYIGGQDAVDHAGNIIGKGDFKAQTEQILKNLQAALAAAEAKMEHIVKWNLFVVQGQSLQAGLEVFQRAWGSDPIHRPFRSCLWPDWRTLISWPRWTPSRQSRNRNTSCPTSVPVQVCTPTTTRRK